MASIQKSFEGQKMHRYVKRSFTLNLQSIGSLFYRLRYFQKQDYVDGKNDREGQRDKILKCYWQNKMKPMPASNGSITS